MHPGMSRTDSESFDSIPRKHPTLPHPCVNPLSYFGVTDVQSIHAILSITP